MSGNGAGQIYCCFRLCMLDWCSFAWSGTSQGNIFMEKQRKNIVLDIIFPVYNERETLEMLVREWHEALKSVPHRFIICEDGSTDGTKQKLVVISRTYPCLIVQKPVRRGYGFAVRDGLRRSSAEFVLCVDSDLQ